jgi:DNA-binding transcriptional LysR family regulator
MSGLPDVVILARVIERGSFARAAIELGVPPSTLSRKVAALERRLGVRVLERTTRQLRPTEIGSQLAERGARIHRELDEVDRMVADHEQAPRGVLRVSVPTTVASDFLAAVMAEYLRAYPDMRVEVVAEDRIADLVAEGFDAAIRLGPLGDSPSLGGVKLATVAPVLAASRDYLERAPVLRHPRDLVNHVTLGFARTRKQTWRFVGRGGEHVAVQLSCRAIATSKPFIAQLVGAGRGIALIPRITAIESGLEIIEPGGFRPSSADVHAVMPSARSAPPKVRAFIALMREIVARRPDLFERP